MAELSVKVGANTKQLENSLKNVDNLIKETNGKLQGLERELKATSSTSLRTASAIDKLNAEFESGSISEATYTKNLSRLTKLQDGLGKKSQQLQGRMGGLNKSLKSLGGSGGSMNKLGSSAVSGTSAMTAFSRTVQDAPFGILGVSNNITNLTEQFGNLKKRTGSSQAALKEMIADLKGFGGVTLAISLVTSLLVAFSGVIVADN